MSEDTVLTVCKVCSRLKWLCWCGTAASRGEPHETLEIEVPKSIGYMPEAYALAIMSRLEQTHGPLRFIKCVVEPFKPIVAVYERTADARE